VWHGGALVERVAAAQASEGRRRRQRWAVPKWPMGRMPLGPARRENKKIEMGRKDDRAKMVLGCAKKKKKFFQILIQGIIFKSKF
jgi:hypothetical protein